MIDSAHRYVLFAAVVVLLGGYLGVYRPAETEIAARYAQLDDARRTLDRSALLARREPALVAEERALRARLASSGVGDDRTAIVARALHAIQITAAAESCTVLGVAAANDVARVPAPRFDGIPLTLSLRGPYARSIAFVRELDRVAGPLQIRIDALDNADPRATSLPLLHATLHLTLLHLAPASTGGPHAAI